MKNIICYSCNKENLTKDEIGLSKKFLGREKKVFYCLECLAEHLEVEIEYLIEKIKSFRDEGCSLF